MSESRIPGLNAADARIADVVFEFVQFLLDDDANLTPAGNLTGTARQKLRTRLQELMAAENLPGDEPAAPVGGEPTSDQPEQS